MNKFLKSSDSLQTSQEILRAIWWLVREDEHMAYHMWRDPSERAFLLIWAMVTKNGHIPASEFQWGKAGSKWAELADPRPEFAYEELPSGGGIQFERPTLLKARDVQTACGEARNAQMYHDTDLRLHRRIKKGGWKEIAYRSAGARKWTFFDEE